MKKKEEVKLPRKVRWMQRLFALGGNIAPRTMTRLVVKFVFTPRKHTLKPPHLECLNNATKFTVVVEEYRKPECKIKLCCYQWGKGEKLILLVHGWDAKAVDYYKMIPVLVHHGYRVVAFDGPAHGQSEGEITSLIHFREIMPEIIAKTGKLYAIIAHSMGAAASTHLLMETDLSVPRLVQLTMPLNPEHFFETVFEFMKVPHKVRYVFMKEMDKASGKSIRHYNLLQRTEKVKAEKVLNVYEEQDEEVPMAHAEEYLKLHADFTGMKVSGVGHNYVMKNKTVMDAIVKFLE